MSSNSDVYVALPALGQSEAVDRVGTIAAPLLAGFAFLLIGVIVGSAPSVRWRDATLAALVVAALLLVSSVQFAFNARRQYLPLAEFRDRLALLPANVHSAKTTEYVDQLYTHRKWLTATRLTYNLGVSVLFLAIAGILLPAGPLENITAWRWLAVCSAVAGGAAEIGWFATSHLISVARRAGLVRTAGAAGTSGRGSSDRSASGS